MIAFTLWLLATLDAAFAGYREAAGRNALIRKRRYYRRAMIKGVLFGQVAVGLAAAVALISLALAADRESLLRDYEAAGFRMLLVYVPFALIILLALLARSIPSVDIRSITSTLIFGPFTLIRPLVAIAGLLYGVLSAPRLATIMLGAFVLTMMLGLEKSLTIFRRSAPATCAADDRRSC
jgi:hypothetical protein